MDLNNVRKGLVGRRPIEPLACLIRELVKICTETVYSARLHLVRRLIRAMSLIHRYGTRFTAWKPQLIVPAWRTGAAHSQSRLGSSPIMRGHRLVTSSGMRGDLACNYLSTALVLHTAYGVRKEVKGVDKVTSPTTVSSFERVSFQNLPEIISRDIRYSV